MRATACLANSGQNHILPVNLHMYSICRINTYSFFLCKLTQLWRGTDNLAPFNILRGQTFSDCVPTGRRHKSFYTRLTSPGLHQSFQLRLAFPWGNQWCRTCPASLGCAHWLPDWNSDFTMMDLLGAHPLGSSHSFCDRTVLLLKQPTWLLSDSG